MVAGEREEIQIGMREVEAKQWLGGKLGHECINERI
jgi:hypothetical protein